jgi:hypothetical protein
LLIFLVVMEFFTFHSNILAEVFVTVHPYGEKFLLDGLIIVEFLSFHCYVLA